MHGLNMQSYRRSCNIPCPNSFRLLKCQRIDVADAWLGVVGKPRRPALTAKWVAGRLGTMGNASALRTCQGRPPS